MTRFSDVGDGAGAGGGGILLLLASGSCVGVVDFSVVVVLVAAVLVVLLAVLVLGAGVVLVVVVVVGSALVTVDVVVVIKLGSGRSLAVALDALVIDEELSVDVEDGESGERWAEEESQCIGGGVVSTAPASEFTSSSSASRKETGDSVIGIIDKSTSSLAARGEEGDLAGACCAALEMRDSDGDALTSCSLASVLGTRRLTTRTAGPDVVVVVINSGSTTSSSDRGAEGEEEGGGTGPIVVPISGSKSEDGTAVVVGGKESGSCDADGRMAPTGEEAACDIEEEADGAE